MYADTSFGDYPTFLPQGPIGPLQSSFTGWMLLNYNKPVMVSSTLGSAFPANSAVDENIKTYWSAKTGDPGEWIVSDLGDISTVKAIQINFADQDVEFEGKQLNIFHRYILSSSKNGKQWETLIDKSKNLMDVPHDYIELESPKEARFIKLQNLHIPTGKFAISGLRIFGKGHGQLPKPVQHFNALRTPKDKRDAWLKWQTVDNAYAYNIYYGIAPDKLYSSIMVYGTNEYFVKSLDKNLPYYFTIEAINEQGVSKRTEISIAE
jgi:hypothetical protein